MGEGARDALQGSGVEAALAPPGSPFFGAAEAGEMMDGGVLQGVAERRPEAYARGPCR